MDASYFQSKLKELGQKNSYTVIDLNLSECEIQCIDNFQITIKKNLTIYPGLFDYKDKLFEYLQLFGNVDNSMYLLLTRIISDVMLGFNSEFAGVHVRSFLPTNEYDIPRWHMDRRFFGNKDITEEDGILGKFVMAIKGDGTLVCECNEDIRSSFLKTYLTGDKYELTSHRSKINEFFTKAHIDGNAHFNQIPDNSGCLFIVANEMLEAIHSEPKITKPRLYIAILASTKSNIQEWYQRQTDYIAKNGCCNK